MKSAIVILSIIYGTQLMAQQRAINPFYDIHLKQDYQIAERQYELGLSQSKIANKWGVATLSLSGISLIGFALRGDNSNSNLFSYWAPVASVGTAAVGVFIKLSSLSNIGSGRYKMEEINSGSIKKIGWIQLGTTKNGMGLTYNF